MDVGRALMGGDGLAPTLLVAMPQMLDPNFERAVVLLCKHDEEGALGFIVNRPSEMTTAELLSFEPPLADDRALTIWEGGPVSQERGWLITRVEPEGESIPICEGVWLSSSQAHLRQVLEDEQADLGPESSRLLLGYAGWGPGQLDQELLDSTWLTAPVDPMTLFHGPPETLWERVIRGIGVDPFQITAAPGSIH